MKINPDVLLRLILELQKPQMLLNIKHIQKEGTSIRCESVLIRFETLYVSDKYDYEILNGH